MHIIACALVEASNDLMMALLINTDAEVRILTLQVFFGINILYLIFYQLMHIFICLY